MSAPESGLWRNVALVFAGGFCGTLARYLLSAPLLALAAVLLPHPRGGAPYDVLLINLTGALALGLLYGLFERRSRLPHSARLALGTGLLGAYTTFGTLVYGADRLLTGGATLAALVYLGLSLALGVLAARAGDELAGIIVARRRIARRGLVRARRVWRRAARIAPVPAHRVLAARGLAGGRRFARPLGSATGPHSAVHGAGRHAAVQRRHHTHADDHVIGEKDATLERE